MPAISSIAHALPPFQVSQAEVKKFAAKFFGDELPIQRYLPIFDHAAVQNRHFVVPMSWFTEGHDFPEKNDLYIQNVQELSELAIRKCLEQADLAPEDVDHLVFVSSTGLATPTIDARLIQRLGFRPDVQRSPLWGLGCAGGAIGLVRTWGWSKAYPDQNCLLLAVECCSLTFQHNDRSKRNLVATALFADGAASVLVRGHPRNSTDTSGRSLQAHLIASRSYTWPHTEHIMGWNLVPEGLQVVFSQGIPDLVLTHVRGQVEDILKQHGMSVSDIRHWIVHPGGARVLSAYRDALELSTEQLQHAHQVLEEYGNMSSPTVLFVLQQAHQEAEPGDYGLLMALGPGFSLEIILLRWEKMGIIS